MRIPLRAWLEDQSLGDDSSDLFAEAFLSYQAGAYRSALLFSYLGMIRVVAQRILVARPPDGYTQQRWEEIERDIRDEGRWEKATFDSLIIQKPPIFLLDDDLRDQLRYWRGRRNDAAHWKGTAISAAHVETLWSFVMTHLPKLVVSGGASSLLLQFERHFDPRYTAPGTDFVHLVGSIETAMRPSEYPEFIGHIIKITKEADSTFHDSYQPLQESASKLMQHLLDLNKAALTEALLSQVTRDEQLLVNALLSDPRLITRFPNDPPLVRRLWYELLPFGMSPPGTGNWRSYSAIEVLLTMLRTELIPRDQWPEVADRVVSQLDEGEPRGAPHPALLDRSDPFGFLRSVYQHTFQYPGVEFAANNLLLACGYLDEFPVDVQVASTFISLIPTTVPDRSDDSGDYYWMDYVKLVIPEDYARLAGHFKYNPGKYHEILRVARENRLNYEPFAEAMNPDSTSPADFTAAPPW